jgi:uncharacterized protein YodC (DUF2158 family)
MKNDIEIINVGSYVRLSEEIVAKVITVAIHQGNVVQYECSWWCGETRARDWFSEDDVQEIIGAKPHKMKIGFSNVKV